MEVLFQMPIENKDIAKPIIKEIMEDPFKGKIDTTVKLTVSSGEGNSFYACK